MSPRPFAGGFNSRGPPPCREGRLISRPEAGLLTPGSLLPRAFPGRMSQWHPRGRSPVTVARPCRTCTGFPLRPCGMPLPPRPPRSSYGYSAAFSLSNRPGGKIKKPVAPTEYFFYTRDKRGLSWRGHATPSLFSSPFLSPRPPSCLLSRPGLLELRRCIPWRQAGSGPWCPMAGRSR